MSKAYFRFYEELNEHLPEKMRKVWFEYPLKDGMSVQQAITSLGVPPAEEKRIILTRNYRLIRDEKVTHSYWIRSSVPLEQIRDLVNKLDLSKSIDLLTRCMECNNVLIPIDKQQILPRLKPRTANHFNEFFHCSSCDRIYWKGSHFDNMLSLIHQYLLPD